MPTPCWLKHLCSIRALVPCLAFFLSLRLFLWSTEVLWIHFPAWASKTLSRRRSAPSPHGESAWGLHEQSKPRVRDFIGFLHKPRNISLFLSPLLSYHRLQTTRFRSIKGPQQWATVHGVTKSWTRLSNLAGTHTCVQYMHFLCKRHPIPLELWNTRQHSSSTSGGHSKCKITNQKHENEKNMALNRTRKRRAFTE